MGKLIKAAPKKLSRTKLARLIKVFKKRNFKKLFGTVKFSANIKATVLIISLLIFLGILVIEKEEKPGKLEIKLDKVTTVKIVTPRKLDRLKPRVAIILDDAGGQIPDYSAAFSIEQPVTISVIPHLPRSEEIARKAAFRGFEVMLHLPMEPENGKYVTNDGRMILVLMSDSTVKKVVLDGLQDVRWAVGFNNHMGSRATKSRRIMNAVMSAVKDKPIYFIDSMTSNRSVAFDVAQKNGVLSAKNNVFLDTGTDHASIEAKFRSLVRMAKRNGRAIGIGHITRKQTIKVLKELMPKYSGSGIEFVYVSELVR